MAKAKRKLNAGLAAFNAKRKAAAMKAKAKKPAAPAAKPAQRKTTQPAAKPAKRKASPKRIQNLSSVFSGSSSPQPAPILW